MSSESSLDDLLIDEEELNEQLLTETLSPYAGIGNQSGAFIPKGGFDELNAMKQTAVVLLHRKAAYELDLADEDRAGPQDISEISGMNHSTVRDQVRELREMNLVENDNGSYWVPTYNYERVREFIEGD